MTLASSNDRFRTSGTIAHVLTDQRGAQPAAVWRTTDFSQVRRRCARARSKSASGSISVDPKSDGHDCPCDDPLPHEARLGAHGLVKPHDEECFLGMSRVARSPTGTDTGA
jgi:hypothetical protein